MAQSLLQQLLLECRFCQLGIYTSLNSLDEIDLFRLPLLLFVPDPRIENRLEFGFDGDFLSESEVFVLEFGDFLYERQDTMRLTMVS